MTRWSDDGRPTGPRIAPVQRGAGLLAFVLCAAGVLGFVPGVTEHLDRLAVAGPGSQAELFGLVRVSVLVNALHLVAGGLGLRAVRRGPASSVRYLAGLAVVFFLMFACGVETRAGSAANFLPVDDAATFVNIATVVVALVFMIFLNRTGPDVVREVYVSPDLPSGEPPAWVDAPVVIAPPVDLRGATVTGREPPQAITKTASPGDKNP
ncbi:hypothetical protein FHX74_001690 [Friedmanniella endophytica]|uniref:DUF4383 domain-containing protein n=1 Tax=Microlunatus kandeliicorticis TaxID=1759536 RepID=A0A7W3P5P6_9ACTN|nr:DUF4383 domain-containing protein [Microlunatus kandeliicorticis]MBA8794085.1 hypothetical protein [Microlunatus kandeliicorticis]